MHIYRVVPSNFRAQFCMSRFSEARILSTDSANFEVKLRCAKRSVGTVCRRISEAAQAGWWKGPELTRIVTHITRSFPSIKQDLSTKVATSAGCHEILKNQG